MKVNITELNYSTKPKGQYVKELTLRVTEVILILEDFTLKFNNVTLTEGHILSLTVTKVDLEEVIYTNFSNICRILRRLIIHKCCL